MTAMPTSATPLRSAAAWAEQVTPTEAGAAAAPPDARDEHLTHTPEQRWYHAPVRFASFLGSIALDLLVASVVYLVLFGAGDAEGFLLGDAWVEAGLLLGLAVALSAPKVVVRFVERRRPGTLSSALDLSYSS